MNRHQRKQVDSVMSLLDEAHQKIVHYIAKGQADKVGLLLEECQQAAIAVGCAAEQSVETAGSRAVEAVQAGCTSDSAPLPVVALLEEYCETVYRIDGSLASGTPLSARRAEKLLARLLHNIRNRIEHDLPAHKEAVFFPYKASMWDSLESVWRVAAADESCDAYVVPIPYYDKNPDGTVNEWHYEIDQYPPDVPVTDYRDYDLERRPDIIFIHNPYDDYNLVTSVHPDFYSKKLKKYTSRLVYIPYFVLSETEPDDAEATAKISNFAQVPGVINADLVVLQSEKMRQCYINSLVQMAGESSRKKWEQKILGLGSPKFDSTAAARRSGNELPDNWKRHIIREDGSRKKVIFYNTSVTALLTHREKMFEKMRRVFAWFKEHKNEAVLLWRPHPLIPATIESMCPQLRQDYSRLVADYKEGDYGIYDDSPMLERAIAASDGYYGDPSSVVPLCQSAGIPVMIQNVDI